MFADTATIEVRAGKGGDGRSSFRHEKYRAMGGPDGGNGARGGNVILRVDHNLNTLVAYRNARTMRAEDGQAGGPNRMNGKNGGDIVVPMPQGTQIWEGDQLLADLTGVNDEVVIARGGRGGFGNSHFKSSTRQAPRNAELGEPGEARKLRLELKMVADVGLVGLPNAGKSTLLSVISNAKPEIGDYAFTTLVPNLGVVDVDEFGFLVADIPGLIEGASEGRGLGDEFLRHIERTAVLLHLIDAGSADPAADYRVIQNELASYQVDLSQKPQIVVITKQETVEPATVKAASAAVKKAAGGAKVYAVSAQAHTGLLEVLRAAAVLVKAARAEREQAAAEAALPVIDTTTLPDVWQVTAEGENAWRVAGERIEGFARRTNFDQDDGVRRLRDILEKTGVARELRRQGATDGASILIGDSELIWLG
ncbi:MAG TPA: GTPase ObgE [Candidatus Saccharimonadia bacterium]|nr:GTPase ObgE [Candidatus Saccharimonadia bacterium]